ncbi:acyl carrier protein [Nocardioides scoriae]|uniref:Acyl carrier protein n=1 Tax=Nocardioides scoriae TaxID=642780 RepID=A0A1H1M6U7_9ACTN|nr:acyl carrier protein [Nocardioides scoriae]SDR82564.1 acyl carrier protein [Nocardioides scoriae]
MPQTFPPHLVAEVASLVELVTGTPSASVRPESRFVDDLEVDSLSMIEVLEGLERRLGVVVADSATSQLVHVGDLLDYLVTHGAR